MVSHVSSMLDGKVEPWNNLTPSEPKSSPSKDPSFDPSDQLNGKSSTSKYHQMGKDVAPIL